MRTVNPPPISNDIAGGVKLDTELVQRKLGANTWKVWVALLWRRDRQGYSWATRETLSAASGLKAWQVRAAVTRLGTLQLVTAKARYRPPRSFAKRVFGDYRNGQIVMPSAQALLVSNAGTRGGDRRSKDEKVAKIRREKLAEEARRHLKMGRRKQPEKIKPGQVSTRPNQDFTPDQTRTHKIGRYKIEDLLLTKKKGCAQRSDQKEEKNKPRLSALIEKLQSKRSRPSKPEMFSLPEEGTDVIPPLANPFIFRNQVRTKAPPKLDPDASINLNVFLLVQAYRGAHDVKLGSPSFILSGKEVRETKYWEPLVAAVNALIATNVSPGSWALWSYDGWAKESGKKKAPPLRFVWDASRIEKQHGWFKSTGAYQGGRLWRTDAQKEYVRRWRQLEDALFRLSYEEGSKAQVQMEMLRQVFPEGVAAMIERAREDQMNLKSVIDRAVDRGDWSVL